jgi:uncharacterized protein (DUF305 family)
MLRPLAFAAALLAATPVLAQQQHQHHGSGMAADSASTKAYKDANMRMHKGMDLKFTGDADRDFAAGMIPHHQGAIDMAKTVLQYGKDPELKKLAQDIIKAQEGEIAFLKAWLAKQPK